MASTDKLDELMKRIVKHVEMEPREQSLVEPQQEPNFVIEYWTKQFSPDGKNWVKEDVRLLNVYIPGRWNPVQVGTKFAAGELTRRGIPSEGKGWNVHAIAGQGTESEEEKEDSVWQRWLNSFLGWFRKKPAEPVLTPVPVVREQPLRVRFIVNQLGELGVAVNDRYFFPYKGQALDYTQIDLGTNVLYREATEQDFDSVKSKLFTTEAEFLKRGLWDVIPRHADAKKENSND